MLSGDGRSEGGHDAMVVVRGKEMPLRRTPVARKCRSKIIRQLVAHNPTQTFDLSDIELKTGM